MQTLEQRVAQLEAQVISLTSIISALSRLTAESFVDVGAHMQITDERLEDLEDQTEALRQDVIALSTSPLT